MKAILATHGFKVHENYDPLWRHVRVPDAFLQRVYPMAEGILESIEGLISHVHARQYWA